MGHLAYGLSWRTEKEKDGKYERSSRCTWQASPDLKALRERPQIAYSVVSIVRTRIASAVDNVRRTVRRVVNTILVLTFLVVAIYGLATSWPSIQELLGQDCDTQLCCQDCETMPVGKITDGDTFFSGTRGVRTYGYDTPEVGERCANEGTNRLRELAGQTVGVEAGPRQYDGFGRRMFYVYTGSGDSIDELMVREGLAWAWTHDGQHRDFLGGILKKCVTGQAVYPLSEQDGLKAQERRYTAYGKEKH